jgi:8-oxo-dGTP diphosphatase
MFSVDRSEIALIRKNKPAQMAGKLNGIGGKIELGETPYDAMVREFTEEAGIAYKGWVPFVKLKGPGFTCYFYTAFTDEVYKVKSMEAEQVELYHPMLIGGYATLQNLQWLIPMALDPFLELGTGFIELYNRSTRAAT